MPSLCQNVVYTPPICITIRLPFVSRCSCRSIRAACLQNETAPKNFNFKTKNGPKNDPKLPRKILSLVLLCRISHRHYSKIFHREFPHKIKYFFTTRICRHGHAKKYWGQGSLEHPRFRTIVNQHHPKGNNYNSNRHLEDPNLLK